MPALTAFVVTDGSAGAPELAVDLRRVGIDVVGSADSRSMVQEVIRSAPDLVVCYESYPGDALFVSTAALSKLTPRPVVVFTGDPDAEKIERATASGIHAYVISGYALARLRPVVHVAQARFRHEQVLRDALSEVQHRFDERKLIDRAKGILMRVRNISEDEAYRALRTAAMGSKQRIGQAAQGVIDAARYADAVNRAGQLRMLSQRLVKLYALLCAGVRAEATALLFRDSLERVEATLATLGRTLSKPTFGDLLEAVLAPWTPLKGVLAAEPGLGRLPEVDALAERLLAQAEILTRTLESAGTRGTLRVINVSGRQRMLSQRLAKQAIVAALLPNAAVDRRAAVEAEASFADGFTFLRAIPLTTPEIAGLLDAAETAWAGLKPILAKASGQVAQECIAVESEALLGHFDRLTDLYERGMEILLGAVPPSQGEDRRAV